MTCGLLPFTAIATASEPSITITWLTLFFLLDHLDRFRGTLIGTQPATLTVVNVNHINVLHIVDGAVRTNHLAPSTLSAQFQSDHRPLIPPGPGFVIQRGTPFND